jgi:hypothetical protein
MAGLGLRCNEKWAARVPFSALRRTCPGLLARVPCDFVARLCEPFDGNVPKAALAAGSERV